MVGPDRLRSAAADAGRSARDARGRLQQVAARTAVLICGAAAIVGAAGCGNANNAAVDRPADVVFENGAVYTVDPAQEWAEAVAVKGKRIVYVGDMAGVAPFKGANTRVVDLAGRMLMPGFVEGHTHALFGAAITRGVDLQKNTSAETIKVLDDAKAAPDHGLIDGVVRGFGWRYSAFPKSGPTKAPLDALWPDDPALLVAVDGHSAWVNSKALSRAGVTCANAEVVAPRKSYFETDCTSCPGGQCQTCAGGECKICPTCEVTGYVVEAAAGRLVSQAVAPYTREYLTTSLEKWVPMAAAAGITGVFDAGIAVTSTEEGYEIYSDLERRGELPFRVFGSLLHNTPGVDPFPELDRLHAKFQSGLVRLSWLKIVMDGVDANGTAAMLKPYEGTESRGDPVFTAQQTDDLVREADARGIDVHVHAIGDLAARQTLDAIASAIAVNPPRDRRHTIAHNQLTDPADLARFAELGVIAQFSGQWHSKDGTYWSDVTVPRWGTARASREYRIAEILRLGGAVSLGTDWPAGSNSSVFKPLTAIQIAVTRQELDKPDEPPLPPADDRLTLAQALHANTMGSAYQVRMEDELGSIAVGKLADLIVLEKNLFAIDVHDVAATGVDMTMMNGSFTHGG